MSDSLLNFCVCGCKSGERKIMHLIPVIECANCGIIRQYLQGYTKQKYFDYYRNDYHSKAQAEIGLQSYKDRYLHDAKIASLRLEAYENQLKIEPFATVLDIGSSNNAFVDYLNLKGYQCEGVEIGEEGTKHPETTYTEDLLDLELTSAIYDLVTLHDVFEHLISPIDYLAEIKRILKPGGFMVLDLPNYFVEQGLHHWRAVQHLWFFNEKQTIDLLQKNGFKIIDIKQPILSKLVFYCES